MSASDTETPGPDAAEPRPGPNPAVPRLALILGATGRTLITAGIVVFLFVAYQLWGTGIQEQQSQNRLSSQLDQILATAAQNLAAINDEPAVTITTTTTVVAAESPAEETPVTAAPTTTSTLPGGYDPDLLALFFPENGDALARLEIPAIGIDKVTVRGVDVADLRRGPGHYPTTALPGNEGNSGIAGHRTTYGAPFNRINELMPGDEITLTGVQGGFTYRVSDPTIAYAGYEEQIESFGPGYIIVKPTATWVLGEFGDNRITLTACHPKLSARQRIIVTAELVGEPARIPGWAAEAEQAAAAALVESQQPDLGAADVTTTAVVDEFVDDSPTTTIKVAASTLQAPQTPDLDQGLNGERGAIPGAILWMIGAMSFWIGGGYLGRHRTDRLSGRVAYRLAALVPAVVFMWYSFEMIDRALPAY